MIVEFENNNSVMTLIYKNSTILKELQVIPDCLRNPIFPEECHWWLPYCGRSRAGFWTRKECRQKEVVPMRSIAIFRDKMWTMDFFNYLWISYVTEKSFRESRCPQYWGIMWYQLAGIWSKVAKTWTMIIKENLIYEICDERISSDTGFFCAKQYVRLFSTHWNDWLFLLIRLGDINLFI